MNNLAETLRAQGDLAGARRLQEQTLDIYCRVLGLEHPNALTMMNNLALTLRAQGDLAEARKMQEKTLEITRRLRGQERPDTLASVGNLANTLFEQGDSAAARKLAGRNAGHLPASAGAGTPKYAHHVARRGRRRCELRAIS